MPHGYDNLYDLLENGVVSDTQKMYNRQDHGIMQGFGDAVPSNGATGYGTGCIWAHTDGTTVDTVFYVNIGDTTSANFDSVSGTTGASTYADNTTITFGTGSDYTLAFNATDLEFLPATNDLGGVNIGDGTTDGDFKVFLGDAGDYVLFDVGDVTAYFVDVAVNIQDTVTVGVNDTGFDVIFYGEGDGDYMQWDESANSLVIVAAGHTGLALTTNFTITGTSTFTGAVAVGVNDTGHDVTFYGKTDGSYLLWDESDDRLELNGADINVQDGDFIQLGDEQDITMTWDGSHFLIGQATANSAIYLGADNAGIDVLFYGDTASAFMLWDQTADDLIFDGAAGLSLLDGNLLRFGDLAAGDINMNFDGTNFEVEGAAAATTVLWGADSHVLNTTWKGTLTIGKDDTGHDVKIHGATAGRYLEWDESGDVLNLDGHLAIINTRIATMVGAETWDLNTAPIQTLDPDGARTITLPAANVPRVFFVSNQAGGAEVMTIQDPTGPTTIATPTQNEAAIVWSDGTTWHGIVGAES